MAAEQGQPAAITAVDSTGRPISFDVVGGGGPAAGGGVCEPVGGTQCSMQLPAALAARVGLWIVQVFADGQEVGARVAPVKTLFEMETPIRPYATLYSRSTAHRDSRARTQLRECIPRIATALTYGALRPFSLFDTNRLDAVCTQAEQAQALTPAAQIDSSPVLVNITVRTCAGEPALA